MTPPLVAAARLDAVLRSGYKMMPSKRRELLRHVFGKQGQVMVAHLVVKMQEPPYRWTAEQARGLGALCVTGVPEGPRPAA